MFHGQHWVTETTNKSGCRSRSQGSRGLKNFFLLIEGMILISFVNQQKLGKWYIFFIDPYGCTCLLKETLYASHSTLVSNWITGPTLPGRRTNPPAWARETFLAFCDWLAGSSRKPKAASAHGAAWLLSPGSPDFSSLGCSDHSVASTHAKEFL